MDNLSRFFYCKSTDIPSQIDDGVINAWDIVITSDDHRFIVISDNNRQIEVGGNVTRGNKVFDTMAEAEAALMNSADIIVGDIICVRQYEKYIPYIVNLDLNGDYILDPFVTGDYAILTNKPMIEEIEVSGHKTFNDFGLQGISNTELEAMLV